MPLTNQKKPGTNQNISLDVLTHHLASFQKNDLTAVMADYTNESVFITSDATYRGIEEIAAFFAVFISHFPSHESTFHLDKIIAENDMGFIIWHCQTPTLEVSMGSDTIIIRDRKIYQQTFVGNMRWITKEASQNLQ